MRLLLEYEAVCHPDDNVDVEYENIQLDNVEEDVCHPFDDDRSPPCSDDEENDIDITDVRDFVNIYFNDDFWQNFRKEDFVGSQGDDVPEGDKGKSVAVALVPSDDDNCLGNSRYHSDSEDEKLDSKDEKLDSKDEKKKTEALQSFYHE
ncbi:hypothetical protein C5167_016248 [Papaver somniferum]|nr:hypothetical protein C5167_016248 [Papaver somniferum]